MGKYRSTILIHLAIWVLLIQLVFDWVGLVDSILRLSEGYLDEAFLVVAGAAVIFYANMLYLAPRLLRRATWVWYVIALCAVVLAVLSLTTAIAGLALGAGWQMGVEHWEHFMDMALPYFLVAVGISTAVSFSGLAREREQQRREAERGQREAELKFLSTQVSPHFLFNTLNGIYSLAQEEDAEQTAEAIMNLSELMRYPLSIGDATIVSVEEELHFLEQYLALQRSKLGADYPVRYEVAVEDMVRAIPPLLFIPLVENAFKYGVSMHRRSEIVIGVTDEGGVLRFWVENELQVGGGQSSHQIGLQNLRERLALLYPGVEVLRVDSGAGRFRAELAVPEL